MRPNPMRRAGITAVAGSLLLLSGSAPFALEGKASLQVLGTDVASFTSGVTLFNPNRAMQTGTLVIEVELGGQRTLMFQRFAVPGGNKVFVSWVAPTGKSRVIAVGVIVDDGAPF